MEAQKTPASQSNAEQKEASQRDRHARFRGMLQSYSRRTKQFSAGTETEMQIGGTKQKTQTRVHIITAIWYLTKTPKIHTGEKAASSTNGAVETGCSHIEE